MGERQARTMETRSDKNDLLKAINQTTEAIQARSNAKFYVRANVCGHMYFIAESGLIITQAPDPETLLSRMNAILRTYEE